MSASYYRVITALWASTKVTSVSAVQWIIMYHVWYIFGLLPRPLLYCKSRSDSDFMSQSSPKKESIPPHVGLSSFRGMIIQRTDNQFKMGREIRRILWKSLSKAALRTHIKETHIQKELISDKEREEAMSFMNCPISSLYSPPAQFCRACQCWPTHLGAVDGLTTWTPGT